MIGRKPAWGFVTTRMQLPMFDMLLALSTAVPTADLTTLYSFGARANGSYAWAGLVQASDGNFYRTMSLGAIAGGGAGWVYRILLDGIQTNIDIFDTNANGPLTPDATLPNGPDGASDDTLWCGGTPNWRTAFRTMPQGQLTVLYSFKNGTDGGCPVDGLALNATGKPIRDGIYSRSLCSRCSISARQRNHQKAADLRSRNTRQHQPTAVCRSDAHVKLTSLRMRSVLASRICKFK